MLVIHKASAGSGKTYTLTKEYLRNVLAVKTDTDGGTKWRLRKNNPESHRHILGITFTNKATDEMKRRIIHELAVMAGMERDSGAKSPYEPDFTHDFNCSPEELRESARFALHNLLFDFHYFQISTIDSFFQQILRTFAREAELTGNYEPEIDNNNAIQAAVRDLFDALRNDPADKDNKQFVRLLTHYMLDRARSGKGISLFNRTSTDFSDFLNFLSITQSEKYQAHREKMTDYLNHPEKAEKFAEQLSELIKRLEEETAQSCRHLIELTEGLTYTTGKRTVKTLSVKDDGISAAFMQHIIRGSNGIFPENRSVISGLERGIDEPLSKLKSSLAGYYGDSAPAELTEAISAACRNLSQSPQKIKVYRAIYNHIYFFGLLRGVFRYLEEYHSEANTVALSDTTPILKKIIGEDDTPFVFERMGVWLNHFLIDEFQDTSAMQWDVLRPLVEQGPSRGDDSLIIGDEKQCIYRFRSSDPELLQNRVEKEFEGLCSVRGTTPKENTNWRSSADVVEFNSEFFGRMATAVGIGDTYANVRQPVPEKNSEKAGYVIAHRTDRKENFVDTALKHLADDLRRQIEAGYKGKDICVLTRTNSEGGDIISFLFDLFASDPLFGQLSIISDDALRLTTSPAVRHIVSVLRHLNSFDIMPYGKSSAEAAETGGNSLKSHHRSNAELRALTNRYENFRSKGASASEALQEAVEEKDIEIGGVSVYQTMRKADCFNLSLLVEQIISIELSGKTDAECVFISAFQDVVTDYLTSGSADLNSFLSWWDACGYKSTVSPPDDDNAVRVMTIHKAKGLEWPCVHVPLLKKDLIDLKGLTWYEKVEFPGIDPDVVPDILLCKPCRELRLTPLGRQWEQQRRDSILDETNILYVAMTRAVNELCFTYLATPFTENIPLGAIFEKILPSMEMPRETSPEDDNEDYSYYRGQPTRPAPEKSKERTALDIDATFSMPAYNAVDHHSEGSVDRWKDVCIDTEPEYYQARGHGIILHDVLARVHRSSDLRKAVNGASARGYLPADAREEVYGLLKRELDRDDVRPWFDGFVSAVRERPILNLPAGNRRPDRIVWTADGHVDVIDYKFGEHRAAHRKQVGMYVNALKAMGETDVRGFIWYVTEGEIIQIN